MVALAPSYLLLAPETGVPARDAIGLGAEALRGKWIGLGLITATAVLLALLLRRVEGSGERGVLGWAGNALRAPPPLPFVAGAGLLAATAGTLAALVAFGGRPHLLDTSVQYVHARYLAAGMPAGPSLPVPEFWSLQFMLETPAGWVSQYPPGQIALLAAGFVVGAPWIVGPVLAAATVVFTALWAERIDDVGDAAVVRAGILLAALSPFFVLLAGANLSHVGAAAAVAASAWFALRASDGRWAWSLAAGAAAGLAFTVRPLTGALVGGGVVTASWLAQTGAGWAGTWRRFGGALLGASPFLAGVGAYNLHFFGAPTRFGYLAATGPSQAPGFHLDPWGRMYGPVEALGHTATDLLVLDARLFGVLAPAVILVGLYLLAAPRLDSMARVLLAWCLLSVVAAFAYWHHDLVLGPRMLGAAAPAWSLLAAVAAAGLARRIPDVGVGGLRLRAGFSWSLAAGAAATVMVLGPTRVLSTAGPDGAPRAASLSLPDSSVVFVHEDWSSRIGASLHARGLRLDSLRSLMRRYPPCPLHLSLHPSSNAAECRRQLRADRFGSLSLATFLWHGSLPGIEGARPLYVRDLGPDANGDLLRRYPRRSRGPVLLPSPSGPGVRAVEYDRAMEMLWDPRAAAR